MLRDILFVSLFITTSARLSNITVDYAENVDYENEECLGLVLLTATLCLMVPMIHRAQRAKRY